MAFTFMVVGMRLASVTMLQALGVMLRSRCGVVMRGVLVSVWMDVPVLLRRVFGLLSLNRLVPVAIEVGARFALQANVELGSGNVPPMLAGDPHGVTLQVKPGQLLFELVRIHPQVKQGANEHVTAEPAKNVKV